MDYFIEGTMHYSHQNVSILPLIISSVSAAVAFLALGWNIYRDVILRARVKLRLGVFAVVFADSGSHVDRLLLSVTNMGPGKIRFNKIPRLKKKNPLKKTEYAILPLDYNDPFNAKAPTDLDVAESADLHIVFNKDCFLKKDYTHIGIVDSFGRQHWVPKKDFRAAKKTYHLRFGAQNS